MAYARLITSGDKQIVVDYTEIDPALSFVPSLAAEFIEVPEGTVNGATLQDDGTYVEIIPDRGLSGAEAREIEEAGDTVPAGPGGDTLYDRDFNVITKADVDALG